MGLPGIFSHRLSLQHLRRRKSTATSLDFTSSLPSIDDAASERISWFKAPSDWNVNRTGSDSVGQGDTEEEENNMDSVLKSRNMRSASARRKRIEEREADARREEELVEKRRREIVFGYASDEEQDSDSDDNGDENTYSPIEERILEESEKDSDGSFHDANSHLSPDGSPSSTLRRLSQRLSAQVLPLKINTQGVTVVETADTYKSESHPPSPPPKPEGPAVRVIEEELFRSLYPVRSPMIEYDSETDADVNENYSPIEVATSVVYQLPRRRPTLISVASQTPTPPTTSSQKETIASSPAPKEQNEPKRKTLQPRRNPSTTSMGSGFQASEATPFEIPPSPPQTAFGFDFNLPSKDTPSAVESQTQPESPKSRKRSSSSLLSRSRSWRRRHNREENRVAIAQRPTTSSSIKSPNIASPTSPSSVYDSDDWDFEIPPGFPMPPTNIPTPMSFLTEDPSLTVGLNITNPIVRSLLPPPPPPHDPPPPPSISESQSSPSTPSSSFRTGSPAPSISSSATPSNNSSLGGLMRKKSLNGLRNRSGSIGKVLASKVRQGVKNINIPAVPQAPTGSIVRDFA